MVCAGVLLLRYRSPLNNRSEKLTGSILAAALLIGILEKCDVAWYVNLIVAVITAFYPVFALSKMEVRAVQSSFVTPFVSFFLLNIF